VSLVERSVQIIEVLDIACDRDHGTCRSGGTQVARKAIVSPINIEESQPLESADITQIRVSGPRKPPVPPSDIRDAETMIDKPVHGYRR
jgi:hypothetical protein